MNGYAKKRGVEMKKEAAEYVARVTVKAASEFTNLIPLIKEFADSDEEYQQYRKALTVIARIAAEDIFHPVLEQNPDLQEKLDKTIAEFGRLP